MGGLARVRQALHDFRNRDFYQIEILAGTVFWGSLGQCVCFRMVCWSVLDQGFYLHV